MPALDPAALSTQIKRGKLGPLYLLVGEDTRRIDGLVDGIEATIDPADRPFAVERIYAAEAGGAPLDIAAAARVFPMLGDRRIVIVLRAERILKPKRASRAESAGDDEADASGGDSGPSDFGPLEDYVAAPVESTTLVFVASEIDKSRRFTKKLVQAAQVVSFEGLGGGGPGARREMQQQVRELVEQDLAAVGRTIEPAAAQLLVERAGGDINRLRG
ncbi:MAG: hypothetical protein R2752_23060, partial [Vicinamibacterales bacterium]